VQKIPLCHESILRAEGTGELSIEDAPNRLNRSSSKQILPAKRTCHQLCKPFVTLRKTVYVNGLLRKEIKWGGGVKQEGNLRSLQEFSIEKTFAISPPLGLLFAYGNRIGNDMFPFFEGFVGSSDWINQNSNLSR